MSETFDHNLGDHDDPVAGPTWFLGLVGAVLMVVTVLGLTALYYNMKAGEVEVEVIDQPRLDVLELRRQQEQLLAGPPRRVTRDEQGKTVEALVIPIQQAMELVVEESNAGS